MNIDWSKAPEDATYCLSGRDFFKLDGDGRVILFINGYTHNTLNHIGDFLSSSIVERPKKQDAWDGEGLPPAGLDVEIKRGNCTWIDGDEWQIGKTATVMASFLNSRDIEMASVQFPGGHCECILARCLSPIRTSEQVAAEEWDKARTEALNAMTANGKTANEPEALWKFRLKVVGEMLDMGYRKQ